jgi:tRNA1(Val) A37 N6-methylase TrmN6
VLAALARHFGDVAVLPVHPRPAAPAIRVIVRARKANRAPLTIYPGLVLNDAAGRPTEAAEAVLRAAAPLPLTLS